MPRAPEPTDGEGVPELPPGLVGVADPRAGIAYRVMRRGFRVVAWLLRFRVVVEGLEHLPRDAEGRRTGGWIAAGLPHRTWVDPFLVWMVLPAEPRLVFFGDARTMARSPLRRWVVRRVGGILPIPSHGGRHAFETHLAAAVDALRAGTVFSLFPESGPAVPVPAARPIAPGIGYFALRAHAPIVPIVLGGTHELFLGRTIVIRILPALDPATLAADGGSGGSGTRGAEDGARAERDAAHRIAQALHARTAEAVARAHLDAEPPPGTRKRGTRLTTLFR
jgi:1-acyl-sn-glycerol-3-phosphate acyltransferase